MKYLLIILSLSFLAGCSKQTIKTDSANYDYLEKQTHHFFLQGFGQRKTINTANVCKDGDKVVQVQSKMNAMQVFLTTITLTIYTPMTATVYCTEK
tara:strand:- start:378 stop:665 length:288 start_codon:yes stop_codon:yes gene_type:complete